jgi:hypothetical protein
MLLADDRRFVIPTATKTGTFSMESALRHAPFTQHMPRHDPNIPSTHHGAIALLMLRNPYDRLVSMYTWGKTKKHSTLLRWGKDGFEVFCEAWAHAFDHGTNLDWTTPLSTYCSNARETCSRVLLFQLEKEGPHKLLQVLDRAYHLSPDGRVLPKHINTSAHVLQVPRENLWTNDALAAIGTRLAEDVELGDYDYPEPY